MEDVRVNEFDQFNSDSNDTGSDDADETTRLFSQLFDTVKTAQKVSSVTDVADKDSNEGDGTENAPDSEDNLVVAGKLDDKAQVKEVIEVAKLAPEKQAEVDRIRELQGLIVQYASKLKFSSDEEKKAFIEKLQKELGEPVEGEPGKYHKLPEFGETTREGFRRIKELFEKGHVPDLLGALDQQLLEIPPGFPLKIAGKQEDVLKSSEQLRQEIRQGKGYLDIDPSRLEDVKKLSRVTDWVSSAEKALHANYVERLERYLSRKVEEGIKEGKFPQGWRRPEGMDKETWCSAVEQSMHAYTRVTRIVEAIDHLNKSGTGFKSDGLDKLPPGVTITRDGNGRITNIDFGASMIQDIRLQSDGNRQKLDPLMSWCDKHETKVQQALGEAFKDRNHVPGFGEYEVHGGWVNPKTKEFVIDNDKQPGSDWQKFNLFSYDLEIKEERDAFGRLSKVYVSSDVAFQEVPPFGYLNTFAQDVHRTKSEKPVEYKPDDYVAVQTGPGQVEMIKAKDLADWKTRQQIKHYGEKGITLTMDASMVVSGLGELRAAAKVAQIGSKEAVQIGGRVLKTEVAVELPKGITAGLARKGLFEIGLGLTGVFHNAGAHEVPWMKAVSDLRTLYFLGHASWSVAELTRLPKAGRAVGEVLSPRLVKTADGFITSIRGTEEFIKASQLAKAGALEKLPFWKGLDVITHGGFNVSEKAFVGMFIWQSVGMSQRFADPYRPKALEAARKNLSDANLNDPGVLEHVMEAGNKPSEQAENYMRRFTETLPDLRGQAKEEAEEIIAKVKELSKPGVSEEDKQKYIQELMKYFRYDGKTISSMQDNKFRGGQLSEEQLTERARGDKDKFNPNLKKVAAVAILTLGRKSDGSWPENISSRKETVPEFTELTQVEDQVIASKNGPIEVEQKLTAEELVKLLREDLQEQTDPRVRTEKAAALHENGLVSGEQLGDLLLSRIEGKQAVSKADRNRAIADLAGLITRLQVEEKLREGQFNRSETFAAKGLTAGLTSADLIRRLEQVAVEADDKDVRATALLCLSLIKKEHLDNTDRDRIRDFFLKDPPGITDGELKKLLENDATSKPTDKAGWERKLIAAETLVRISMVPDAGKIDTKSAGYLQECLTAKDQPEIAVRALEALMAGDRLGGSPLLALEKVDPDGNWRRKLVIGAINNLDMPAATALEPGKQLEAARARLKFIELASTLLQGSEDRLIKGQFAAKLLARADSKTEPVEEVRAAAVKAIGNLGIRAKMQVEILKNAVDAKTEYSPAVRLAAVDAIERLLPRNKERREILGPLAVPEPDAAVKERMARYYDPTGSIRDRNSQRSRQEVVDAKVEQNKQEFKPSDIDRMVVDRYKKMAGSKSIFDYIDADREPHKTLQYRTTLAAIWDSTVKNLDSSWTEEYIKEFERKNLIVFELIAQNRAVTAFNKGVEDLNNTSMTGSKDKTVQVGDKTVSERDAAILALGSLVRNGSRMGPAFYQHRDTHDRRTSTPGLRSFNSNEQSERYDFARSSSESLQVYESDPWTFSERKIAEKLRDLCSQSSDNVNLSLLKDEMLRALKSDAKTSDESRRILVDGLDKLLSNPGVAPEAKREILKAIGEMVKTAREVQKDKVGATVAMIDLLDKHGKASFETYSDAYSTMRVAVVSRAENDQMPPQLRLRAREMFERQWVSVLAEADRIPTQQGTERTLNEFLPKNFESLEKGKEGKTNGYDEDVHDAVQRIIMATKGLPLLTEDVRRKTLQELTDSKYDDRVRMAALHALFQSKTDRQMAEQQLLELALDSKEKAIRQDVVKLLSDSHIPCSEDSLSGLKTDVINRLAAAQGKKVEDLDGTSPLEVLREANEYIEKNLTSSDARNAAKARELQEAMHRYGEGLVLIANLKSGDKTQLADTARIFKLALAAFGVREEDLKKLQSTAQAHGNNHCAQSAEVQELCRRLVSSLQDTGSVPALLSALNGYARLAVPHVVMNDKLIPATLQLSVGCASLSDALAQIYYPEGSQGRIDQNKNLANIYLLLGHQPISSRERFYGIASELMERQAKELESYRRIADVQIRSSKDALNRSIGEQKEDLLSTRVQARLDVLNMTLASPGFKYLPERAVEMSKEIETDLGSVRDKNTTTYKNQRFIKDWLDLALTPDDKKAEARAKAEASLQDAMKATAGEFGTASSQYERLVRMLWQYHKQQNQPERAEEFFKSALEGNQGADKAATRAMLLRQYDAFQERPRITSVDAANKKIAELDGKPGKEAELGDAYKQLSQLLWPHDKAASERAVDKALEIYKKNPPSDKQYLDALDQKKIILLSEKQTRAAELVDVFETQKQILEKGLKPGETSETLTKLNVYLRDTLTHRILRDLTHGEYDSVERDLARTIELDRQLNGGELTPAIEQWLTDMLTKLRTEAFKNIRDKDYDKALRPQLIALKFQRELNYGEFSQNDFNLLNGLLADLTKRTNEHLEAGFKSEENPDKEELAKGESALALLAKLRMERLQELEKQVKANPDNSDLAENLEKSRAGYVDTVFWQIKVQIARGKTDDAFALMKSCMPDAIKADSSFTLSLNMLSAFEEALTKFGKQDRVAELRESFLKASVETAIDPDSATRVGDTTGRIVRFLMASEKPAEAVNVFEKSVELVKVKVEELAKSGKTEAAIKLLDGLAALATETSQREGLDANYKAALEKTRGELASKGFELRQKLLARQIKNASVESSNTVDEMVTYLKEQGKESEARELVKSYVLECSKVGNHDNAIKVLNSNMVLFKSITPAENIKQEIDPLFQSVCESALKDFRSGGDKKESGFGTLCDLESTLSSLAKDESIPKSDRKIFGDKANPLAVIIEKELSGALAQAFEGEPVDWQKCTDIVDKLLPVLRNQNREAEITKMLDKQLDEIVEASRRNKNTDAGSDLKMASQLVQEVGKRLQDDKAGRAYISGWSDKFAAEAENKSKEGNHEAAADAYEAAIACLEYHGSAPETRTKIDALRAKASIAREKVPAK